MKVYELINTLKACNRHAEVQFAHPALALGLEKLDPILMMENEFQPTGMVKPVYLPIKEVQESSDRRTVILMDDPEDNINFANVSEPYPL